MAFCLGNGIWNRVFAVPNTVADDHLKIASGLSVKVLLLLLRHQGNIEPAQIADILGQSPADIQDALNYWQQCGVISATEPADAPSKLEYTTAEPVVSLHTQPPADAPRHMTILSPSRHRLTMQEISEMAQTDKTIPRLLQETQVVLGKPLTPLDTETIISLYSYYGMQPDLILLLIHYCARIGKTNTRYIEKLAADWMDKGIDSHEKAEAEILLLTRRSTAEGRVRSAFGIDRALVSREKEYIRKWTEEYRQDLPLIVLAFERCVELKGKLSFPYINGILKNWHDNGITTPAQATKETREYPATPQDKPKPSSSASSASYDINELEQMIASGKL